MPYSIDHKNKCVYKKKEDGSRGEKVGCTKGSLKSYIAALQIHAESKKFNTKKMIKEDDELNPEIDKPIDGAITQLYAVQKPYVGCELTSLVKPIDPLIGIGVGNSIVPDQVHALFADEPTAQKIATELYETHLESQAALEEKKETTAKKVRSTIDSLEKKRKEHMDMAKEDPKNASEHRQEIAVLANKIDDLMTKLEKIEKSKKPIEEKLEEGFFDRLRASIKGTGAQASTTYDNFKAFLKGDKNAIKDPALSKNIAILQQRAKTLDKYLLDTSKDIQKLFPPNITEKFPKQFGTILTNYANALESIKKINTAVANGDMDVIMQAKTISPNGSIVSGNTGAPPKAATPPPSGAPKKTNSAAPKAATPPPSGAPKNASSKTKNVKTPVNVSKKPEVPSKTITTATAEPAMTYDNLKTLVYNGKKYEIKKDPRLGMYIYKDGKKFTVNIKNKK